MRVTTDMPSVGLLSAIVNQKLLTFLRTARVLEFFLDEQRGLTLVDFLLLLFSIYLLSLLFLG